MRKSGSIRTIATEMSDHETKILEYHHEQKSAKHSNMIYLDFEAMLKKIAKFSMFTKFAYDESKTKNFFYRYSDCMNKFCKI